MRRAVIGVLVPTLSLVCGVALAQTRASGGPQRDQNSVPAHPATSAPASSAAAGGSHPAPSVTSPHPGDNAAFRARYAFHPRTRVAVGLLAGYPIAYPYIAPPSVAIDDSVVDVSNANGGAPPPPDSAPPLPEEGLLLDVQPATAQVFVDGLYVGTVDDFDAFGGPLTPGAHQIELRASGYESIVLPVAIIAGHTASYHQTMAPLAGAPTTAASAGTIYVIPGCYLGNVPPAASVLTPGCDAQQMRTLETPR